MTLAEGATSGLDDVDMAIDPARDLLTLQNTHVRDACPRCHVKADIWRTKYGINLTRLCLKCWAVALGMTGAEA